MAPRYVNLNIKYKRLCLYNQSVIAKFLKVRHSTLLDDIPSTHDFHNSGLLISRVHLKRYHFKSLYLRSPLTLMTN